MGPVKLPPVVGLVLAALLGAVVSGASAWISWGRNTVARAEVIELIETRSPYLRDQRAFNDAMEQIHMLADGQQVIREELAKLHVMVQHLEDNQ